MKAAQAEDLLCVTGDVWEAARVTVKRKRKRLFVICCKSKSPISAAKTLSKSRQDVTGASV